MKLPNGSTLRMRWGASGVPQGGLQTPELSPPTEMWELSRNWSPWGGFHCLCLQWGAAQPCSPRATPVPRAVSPGLSGPSARPGTCAHFLPNPGSPCAFPAWFRNSRNQECPRAGAQHGCLGLRAAAAAPGLCALQGQHKPLVLQLPGGRRRLQQPLDFQQPVYTLHRFTLSQIQGHLWIQRAEPQEKKKMWIITCYFNEHFWL